MVENPLKMLLHLGQVPQVPSITSLVESDQDLITILSITTFKQELVGMPGQAMLLTSITTLVEMSDQDWITILATNTLRRPGRSLTGSEKCTKTKKKQPPDNCYNF